ncbi:MAG TPA: 50S ribosomal protein L30 [Blastocatellia bacterium]
MANETNENKVKIQWYRSSIATPEKHKVIVRSLGFTKLNQIVERPDNDSIRGMVAKVPHLLRIVE